MQLLALKVLCFGIVGVSHLRFVQAHGKKKLQRKLPEDVFRCLTGWRSERSGHPMSPTLVQLWLCLR